MPWVELDQQEMESFLGRERVLRLAMGKAQERYIVPLGYLWYDSSFCCTTTEGRKTELLRHDDRVAFEIDNAGRERPFLWSSVIGEGRVTRIEDDDLILRLRPRLFARFKDAPSWAIEESRQKAQKGSLIWLRITPIWMSGRRGMPPRDEGGEQR